MSSRTIWKKAPHFAGVIVAIARHPLHRGHPIRAVWSALRLIGASTLTPTHHIAVPYVNGSVLNWPVEASSVMLCARFGLGEYADMAFCLHALRPDDLFCDVGANAGVYTILATAAVGAKAISFEPIPRTFNLLMANVHINGVADQVDARRSGVADAPGKLSFTGSLWSLNHVVDRAIPDSMSIDVVTLDSAPEGREPRVIKIDVEGFEDKVLRGATKTLTSHQLQAVVVEVTDQLTRYGDTVRGITSTLLTAGFEGPFWYEPSTRRLMPVGTPRSTKYNHIFVRNKSDIEARLQSAPKYKIHGTEV